MAPAPLQQLGGRQIFSNILGHWLGMGIGARIHKASDHEEFQDTSASKVRAAVEGVAVWAPTEPQ